VQTNTLVEFTFVIRSPIRGIEWFFDEIKRRESPRIWRKFNE